MDQIAGLAYGNGLTATYGYYAKSKRLQSAATSGGLQSLAYTYDQVADIASISDGVYSGAASAAISSVSYDGLHRLTGFTRPATSQTVSCAYDAIGNMTSYNENGSTAYTYTTPVGIRLPHAVKSANGLQYSYDPCGNMLTRGSQALIYNPENRLIASVVSNQTTTFGYDAGGSRLWKQGASTNSLQVWIGGNYEEKDGKILYHISAGDRSVYTYSSDGTVAEYYHPDHLHSAQVMSTPSGALYQHYEYAAYGNSRYTSSSSAFPVSRRYTSQVLDEETGLYYYGARYYDPVCGRFIQPDTMIANISDPQSWNRYSYARNNPFLYVDPNGHAPVDWANAYQPSINEFYGGYISDTSHTSAIGLYGAYMGQSFANGYNDLLRFGTGMAEGSLAGLSADLNRAGGIMLTFTGAASRFLDTPAAPSESGPTPASVDAPQASSAGNAAKPSVTDANSSGTSTGGRYSGRYADGQKAYRTNVPRDSNGNPLPDPQAQGAHSRLQMDKRDPGRVYSATEFDSSGNPIKRTDFAARPGQPVPHEHPYNSNTKAFTEKQTIPPATKDQ